MRRILWLALTLVSSAALANPVVTFSSGSLIIPMQANFQTACGETSGYGLVWKLLYENRPTGAFAGQPVTVYWVINDAKSSPNRCVPTNKHASPLPSAFAAAATNWDNPANNPWSDGCDFTIPSSIGAESIAQQPVVPVDWSSTFPVSGIYPYGTIPEYNTVGVSEPEYDTNAATNGKGRRPNTLDNSGTCTAPCGTARFTKIQYMGGAFVIAAADAKRVIDAIQNASYPHLQMHYGTGTCGFGGGSTYRVNIHQATQSFNAPVYKRITSVPPKIALLDFGGGVKTVLLPYLQRAGLTGSIAGNPVGGTPSSGTSGLVYDRLSPEDLLTTTVPVAPYTQAFPNGYLNSKVGLKSRYKVFWAPHWYVNNASAKTNAGCTSACLGDPGHDQACSGGGAGNGGGSAACDATPLQRTNMLDNIAFFADQKGNGLMAQCRSIGGYETANDWRSGAWQLSDPSNGTSTRFMFTNEVEIEGLSATGLVSWSGKNCTDPDYVNGPCSKYPNPGDPFAQVGDFAYTAESGAVGHFRPYLSGSARRAGVVRLATSWRDYTAAVTNEGIATAGGPPATYNDNGNDFVTITQKDNDPEKSTVIYIGAHNLSNQVAGTRIILNTLLNLGADPIPTDRNLAQTVAALNPAGGAPIMFTSIYSAVTGASAANMSWTGGNEKSFMWPLTQGNLRVKAITPLQNVNELNDSVLFNADGAMPLPANRNLFTYFGGAVTENPSLSASRLVKNNVAQLGWVPERVEYNRINDTYGTSPNPNCVDVQQFGDYEDAVSGVNTGGLIPGPDGICDLQQAFMWSNFAWVIGGGGTHSIPPGHLNQMQSEVPELQAFIQRIRGFCYATESGIGAPVVGQDEIMEPTDQECFDMGSVGDNRAHLGGAVRSSAAVVGPSPKIPDIGNNSRPTVAYIGTWDGQLHAIYVGGGSNYSGPVGGRKYLNANAVCDDFGGTSTPCTGGAQNTFKVNWAAQFAANNKPNLGTELWSFIPASQLSKLKSNDARIDSSPAVADVFVDLYGTGKREWHTVLVVSVGGLGREIFAMDVTNPLKPVLLWDIVGSATGPYRATAASDFKKTGSARPLEWLNTNADYVLPPVADPGRTIGYAYDYSDLGGSSALRIGQMREGLEPTFAVFVSSNSSGYGVGPNDPAGRSMQNALNVFAIDIATGQKLWQWRQPYVIVPGAGFRAAQNTVPPPVTVLNTANGAGILYAGDMEGRIWELNAATGQNMNIVRDGTCPNASATPYPECNFPLFDTRGTDTAPEPITSNLVLAKLPSTMVAGSPFASYAGEVVMMAGTGGTDWVPPAVSGKVRGILMNTTRRKPALSGVGRKLDDTANGFHVSATWTLPTVRDSAKSVGPEPGGIGQEPVSMPFTLTPAGSRVYGFLTVANVVSGAGTSTPAVFIPTVEGVGGDNDPLSISKTLAGSTLIMPLGDAATANPMSGFSGPGFANFGGVATLDVPTGVGTNVKTEVVADQVNKTSRVVPAGGTGSPPPPSVSAQQPTVPYRLYNVMRRFFSQQ
ncbi:MAG: hypothetical protein JNM17_16610 [Archangium sp.]|nr:hypothetical protein [Archangium sp.]